MVDEYLRAARLAWDRKEFGSVWKFANDALNIEPDRPEALYLAGVALRQLGHVGLATSVFRRALAMNPGHINLWMHFASCLHDLHQWDEAREAFMMILKQLPTDAAVLGNIAAGYVQQGNPRLAVEWGDKAVAAKEDHHIGRIARCFGNLGLGRWKDGWRDAEWIYGHQQPLRVYNKRENEEPVWDGSPGKTVVVQCDQGLGDQIMFSQCLADMVKVCKQVIVECSPRTANVWKRNFPEIIAYPTIGEVELEWPARHQIDAHIHISWLGRFYRTRNEDFPRKAYLTPNPEYVAVWREWLAQFPKPWVGITWQGGLSHTMKHLRSFRLAELAPIMPYAGSLFDLSYHDSAKEVAQWNIDHPGQQVIIPRPKLDDYDNTIALIAALDDVVTVTTTVAHVCGAIGRHAYVLVPQAPAWRYQYPAGDGLWWYPDGSVETIRQRPGEIGWQHAVNRVADKMGKIAQLRAA